MMQREARRRHDALSNVRGHIEQAAHEERDQRDAATGVRRPKIEVEDVLQRGERS
jgi:hypothetical protein